MRARILAATAAVVLLLAGCASAPLPRGLTTDELQVILDKQNAQWWSQMFPNEPMPVVEPIRYQTLFSDGRDVTDCVMAAGIDGVTAVGSSLQVTNLDAEINDQFNRVQFTCMLQYPYERSDPESMGYYSREQLEYLYDYFANRLVPCLRLLGYATSVPPSRESFLAADYLTWMPYYQMVPHPQTKEAWQLVDLRCPPSPFGSFYRPGEE